MSARDLTSVEGGFAVPRTDFGQDERKVDESTATIISKLADFSGIKDASPRRRMAQVAVPHGNTNVMFPRTLVPQLQGGIIANEQTLFACVVMASPDCSEVPERWEIMCDIPTLKQCEEWFARDGVDITVCA